jgi:hypothetical protein
MKRLFASIIGIGLVILTPVLDGTAGPRLLAADEGGGGMDVNIIVREVRVTPARAPVGEPVRIEMVVENRAEGAGTARAGITANGRPVATGLYSYGWGGEGGRITRETFVWDTKDAKPGEYRIKGFVTVWEDTSPSDNELEIPEPVVILPQGSAGAPAGSLSVRDPRYRPKAD